MATYRVSFRWQQTNTRTGGWSENFWINKASIPDAKQAADGLLQALVNWKGTQVFCPRIRISTYGTSRLAQTFLTNRTAQNQAANTFDSDYPTTRYQLRNTGTAPQFITQWIGGVLDRDITAGGIYDPKGSSVGAFQTIQTILRTGANGWSINVLNPAVTPTVIASFADATGILTTAQPHGLLTNDIVRVQRVHGVSGINGIWRVQLIDTINVKLLGWVTTGDTMTRSPAATIRKQSPILQQITDTQIVQVTSHRVGRPTGLLGGRRTRPSSNLVGPLVAK